MVINKKIFGQLSLILTLVAWLIFLFVLVVTNKEGHFLAGIGLITNIIALLSGVFALNSGNITAKMGILISLIWFIVFFGFVSLLLPVAFISVFLLIKRKFFSSR